MRRPLLALALLAGSVLAAATSASTASNSVPESTAVYRSAKVNGATALKYDYTVVGGKIEAFDVRVQKVDLSLLTVVTAEFGGDPAVTCTAGTITIVDTLTNLGEGTYTCSVFAEPAGRPRRLTINVS